MPTYEYRCKSCETEFVKYLSFDDADKKLACPNCKKKKDVTKVFGNVGISFKGTGFYKNDSRSGSSKSTTAGASTTSTSDTASTSDSGTKTDSGDKKKTEPSSDGGSSKSSSSTDKKSKATPVT